VDSERGLAVPQSQTPGDSVIKFRLGNVRYRPPALAAGFAPLTLAALLATVRGPARPASTAGVTDGSRMQLAARSRMLVLLVAVPLIFLGCGLAGWSRGWALGVDSSVYRAGAVLLLHGHSLYDVSGLGYLHLSFTYPPAAALVFTPLAALPAQLAWAVMASASVLALVLVIRVAIAAVPYWRFPARWSTLLLAAAMLGLVPVWRTIGLGQVNVVLMAMVAVDVLAVTARGSRWGGLLTGVAAAVKLVPLIFIGHLFLTGKRAAAARALAVFAGLQGLTLAIAPQDRAYWTSYVFQTGRIGPAQQPYNQSLDGLVARLTGAAPWSAHAAWAVGAVLAVPALMLVLRYHRRGQDLAALCVTACFGLLLAPVSWLPCWVWIAPILVALLSWLQAAWRGTGQRQAGRWQRWAGAGAVIGVIAVFTITYTVPISQQRHRTLGSFWFFVLSNPYVLTAIAIALVLGAAALRRTISPTTRNPQASSPAVERQLASTVPWRGEASCP
jgi:alpha-1,2-mannosyltransferase